MSDRRELMNRMRPDEITSYLEQERIRSQENYAKRKAKMLENKEAADKVRLTEKTFKPSNATPKSVLQANYRIRKQLEQEKFEQQFKDICIQLMEAKQTIKGLRNEITLLHEMIDRLTSKS